MLEKKLILSPSLLSCDFARVGEQLKLLENAGVTCLHLDVMDGIFVPNISFGIPVIKSIRKSSKMFFDTHLMIAQPERYISQFASAGSDCITFHIEATENPMEVIEKIKSAGVMAGISIKPNTPASAVFEFLPYVDLVLVMTVEPGFGGQSFMASMMPKVKELREEINKVNPSVRLSVDGGIDEKTITEALSSGADMLVAGSSVFGKEDIAKAAKTLMEILSK